MSTKKVNSVINSESIAAAVNGKNAAAEAAKIVNNAAAADAIKAASTADYAAIFAYKAITAAVNNAAAEIVLDCNYSKSNHIKNGVFNFRNYRLSYKNYNGIVYTAYKGAVMHYTVYISRDKSAAALYKKCAFITYKAAKNEYYFTADNSNIIDRLTAVFAVYDAAAAVKAAAAKKPQKAAADNKNGKAADNKNGGKKNGGKKNGAADAKKPPKSGNKKNGKKNAA